MNCQMNNTWKNLRETKLGMSQTQMITRDVIICSDKSECESFHIIILVELKNPIEINMINDYVAQFFLYVLILAS